MSPDGSVAALLGDDPWWLVLIKSVGVFALLLLITLFTIWFERRVVGRMQHRPGPNWNGPFGLLQSLADALKLNFKEGIIPKGADKFVYIAAPVMAAIPAFLVFTIIPMGGPVSMFGQQTALQLADLPVGVLAALAFTSIGVYGLVLGGWASGSTYPLLGGLRSAAQVISYEIAMGLSFVAVFIYSGTLTMSGIVQQQHGGWYIWLLPVSFVIYVISMVGETNRAPFDLAEAEGELVGGYNTEYSSMRFGLFFLAEYINMVNVSAIATTLFFGGWQAPWPLSLWSGANVGWWTMLWFFIKVLLLLFFFVWLRGTLPRIRYDQFMAMGWKILVPVSLGWILLVATARVLNNSTSLSAREVLLWMGIPLAVLLLALAFWPERRRRADSGTDPDAMTGDLLDLTHLEGHGLSGGQVVAPALGKYPIPPLDLVVPTAPRLDRAAQEPVLIGGGSSGQQHADNGNPEAQTGGTDVVS